jgi:hypothetical protein
MQAGDFAQISIVILFPQEVEGFVFPNDLQLATARSEADA